MVAVSLRLGLAVVEDAPAIQTATPRRMGDRRFFDSEFVIIVMLFLTVVIFFKDGVSQITFCDVNLLISAF